MPAARQRFWASTAALVVGASLLIVAVVFAIALGPSGRVAASTRIASPGVVIIDKEALRASSAPVRVDVRSASGGRLTAVLMLDEDAGAALDSSRHTVIDGVSFLPRELRTAERRDGSLPRTLNADTFLAQPVSGEEVELEIAPSRLPQALLAFPGALGDPRDDALEVSMTWTNGAWFWQALAVAVAGAALLLAALVLRRRSWTRPGPEATPGRAVVTAESEPAGERTQGAGAHAVRPGDVAEDDR